MPGNDGSETLFTYDEFDRLAQIDTPEGVLNYEYDNYGRQVRKSIGNPADPTHDWTYSYDALGRLKTVSTVRRNGVDLNTAEVTTYSYDLVGNLSRVDYANGMITTYEYDALNRLDVMTHYSPDETPENLADNDKLAEYDYTVRADGRRTAVTEKYWESGTAYTTDIAWTYDNLGRLVEEDYDSHNNDLDYTTTFTYDLVGNRLSKVIDGIVDKTLTYAYDDNDRLLTSWKIIGDVDDGVNLETDDTTTTYGYTGTLQTSKTIEETYSTQTLSVVDYSYDLQGRMSEVVIDTYDSNSDIVKKETTTYVYDGRGIRVGSTYKVEEDTDQNPATALVVTKHEETSYLVDDMNPTGYAQVIEKIVREAGTANVTDAKVFTLGHDVIDQTTFTPGGTEAGSPLTLLYDGHGSTRAVLDATAAFVQHYAYTAYGMAIGFDEAQALTALLYSGEAFDSRIGMQYLRARWYDPNSGRFNRLDPFSGNLRDPQSLHKYLYTHGDPVNGIDPTGLEFSILGLKVNMSAMASAISTGAKAIISAAVRGLFKVAVHAAYAHAVLKLQTKFTQLITPLDSGKVREDYQYALLADAAYDRSDVPGWVALDDNEGDGTTGFRARLFQRGNERVIAYAGTDPKDRQDWINNISQGLFGASLQYAQAIEIADIWESKYGSVDRFVGHSLGGGLATAAAVVYNRPATTFNASGLNANFAEMYPSANTAGVNQRVHAYRVQGDILSTLQDTSIAMAGAAVWGQQGIALAGVLGGLMPNSVGTPFWLEGDSFSLAMRHGMPEVLSGMRKMM
ncbi:tRNA(Glu)-specific nuclease WapA precursor [Symmachiella dynata]|uniref:tRNA(Glu)-specific nuclease WapA n=1 Tax=Symmachiella dynata TaxID=2527995 RepID=A0A517ZJ20_9PLAN|nr:RHS repeat-associated core domain-containing protein [Symmachiella dynata]QDU42481.1 tRNA(Glu)-specific nuclease WapA precursor [Symmachiella dynata]